VLAPVSNAKHQHKQLLVLNRVDHSVIAYADAPASVLPATQHLGARGARIKRKELDSASDP
jgi:hypothetical protein